ncbi:MAG: isoleucine--tRNA ligase [Chloroflexi bacterium]|nr:MAG: isoleucine--tRNA ligase [Chloroflexota bacterium]
MTTAPKFEAVTSRVSFPEQEERILDFWKQHEIFKRTVEERPEDRVFSFFEGPPTANGNPGIHHVLARVFKDLIPRYRTMRGYRVPRKGGWDTHGLPVELEVERALGLNSKQAIEEYGVEEFNRQCRESVFKYVSEWERMTDRIGYWVDMENAYVTYSPDYVESCWWIFKRLWENNLVFRDFRVTPHCPRCQTSLSSHEIAQGYKEDTPDPGVTLRFVVKPESASPDVRQLLHLDDEVRTSLLAWTTTPWTLSGNVALAVNAGARYTLVERDGRDGNRERHVVAWALSQGSGDQGTWLDLLRGDLNPSVVANEFGGDALVGLEYEPLYESVGWEGVDPLMFVDGRTQRPTSFDDLPKRHVIPSDHVTTDEGTGILHVAPAFGEDDYVMGRTEGLMFLQPVRLDGTLVGGPGDGLFAKVADRPIWEDLDTRGLLFRRETIRHTYPFCWRCDTPVLYYAKPSWYIRTTAVARKMVRNNRAIHWVPEHVQEGRFGEWLEGNIDWAVSRERYWGTPLPLWVCGECDHIECIGSYEDLLERALGDTGSAIRAADGTIDPHRPYIDRVEIECPECDGTMRRTSEVADAWFDSGAMPYAQWHYPFENEDTFESRFPADFICEAVDQTRGWFYTLHALATLLNHTDDVDSGIAYENVICLGHILDGDGLKMSKSRGNVVNPWSVLDQHGADAVRWYMYTASPPGNSRRFSSDLVAETSRRFLSTLWNTYSFFVTYANTADFDPAAPVDAAARTDLDRWIRSELHQTVQRVTEALEAYEPADAARPIEAFVDQLSNWYVRRSRRRFWRSGEGIDSQAAFATLYECLVTVAKLLAPFTPFLAETMYQNLVVGRVESAQDSVHLADWPEVDEDAIDLSLSGDVALVQRMVSLGRGARAKAQTKVRQPLATAVLVPRNDAERRALERLADQIAEELNVKRVEVVTDPGDRLAYTLRPNLPVLGPKFGADVGKVRGALQQADPVAIVGAMRAGDAIEIGGFTLAPTDILVAVEASEGWAAQEESGYAALVDTTLTPDLLAEGTAREIVRRLQDLRRDAGLDVSDRIHVAFRAGEPVASVMASHGAMIAEEVLALSLDASDTPEGDARADADIDGVEAVFTLRKA